MTAATAPVKRSAKSKPSEEAPDDSLSALDAANEETERLEDAAEELLYEQVRQGGTEQGVAYSHRRFNHPLFKRLGWTQADHGENFRRVSKVLQLSANAGSDADYAKAKEAASQAGQRRDKELPGLLQQLEAIQAKINEIERGVGETTGKVEVMESARRSLADWRLLPPRQRREAQRERSEYFARFPTDDERDKKEAELRELAARFYLDKL